MHGDDEVLLRFLCEMLHPVVRPDSAEAHRLARLLNEYLKNDGFELVEGTRLSGKPVFAARYIGTAPLPGLTAAKDVLAGADPGYVASQVTRMESAINSDPDLAIGTAKELIETCCRTILRDRGVFPTTSRRPGPAHGPADAGVGRRGQMRIGLGFAERGQSRGT